MTTGEQLYSLDADLGAPTAGVHKLITAAAALQVLGPDTRIATRVYEGSVADTIVLVGGGDATLSALPAGVESVYAGAPKVAELAAQTSASLDKLYPPKGDNAGDIRLRHRSHPRDRAEDQPVMDSLSLAGQTGTLAQRFSGELASVALAGTGSAGAASNTLAGIVTAADGDLLALSLQSSGEVSPATGVALEVLAAGIHACGDNLAAASRST